jgi:hypothetical protein
LEKYHKEVILVEWDCTTHPVVSEEVKITTGQEKVASLDPGSPLAASITQEIILMEPRKDILVKLKIAGHLGPAVLVKIENYWSN